MSSSIWFNASIGSWYSTHSSNDNDYECAVTRTHSYLPPNNVMWVFPHTPLIPPIPANRTTLLYSSLEPAGMRSMPSNMGFMVLA